MIEQQVMNYLLWLKERGQGYFVASDPLANDLASSPARSQEDVSGAAPIPAMPVEATKASEPALPLFKVLFLSLAELTPPEHEMVSRIAAALNLKTEDFAIVFAGEAKAIADAQTLCSFVLMGEGTEDLVAIKNGQTALSIPHPGSMLKEPQLKVSAWNTLQKLKAAL